jgi:hypothetical protein
VFNIDTIKITPELLALVAEIDEFKGAWRALGTLGLNNQKNHLSSDPS